MKPRLPIEHPELDQIVGFPRVQIGRDLEILLRVLAPLWILPEREPEKVIELGSIRRQIDRLLGKLNGLLKV